jgi:cyclic pyranopterin phosphate synthase
MGDSMTLVDSLDRPFRDLRISVTDRCNFRCTYCMPKEIFGPGFNFLPRSEILTFEEITRIVTIFAGQGMQKIRLTGGEPTLRSDLPRLIAMLRSAAPDLDIALTTNASRLRDLAQPLADAGLDRITVSLDSVNDEVFRRMNDVDFPVSQVLEGIDAAAAAGLGPIKINAVVQKGVNDHTVAETARYFQGSGHIVRFIEFMDVGSTNGWKLDEVVAGQTIIESIHASLPLKPIESAYRGEVAKRWRYQDGAGEIGVITSVTQTFCGDCTRARLSADGKLYTCLFAASGTDLRGPLRAGVSDAELSTKFANLWRGRDDRYSELRSDATADLPKVEMSFIGG